MIQSTNLCLNTPALDLTRLNNEYQLVKYSFPAYNFRSSSDKDLYKKLILAYKKELDHPFYFYTQDRPSAAFYVLYPLGETPITLVLDRLNQSAKPIPVAFENLLRFNPESGKNDKLHILIKVLLANYFWNESERERRICQGDFYVLGKQDPKKEYKAVGVRMGLLHYETLLDQQDEFCLTIKAENIVKHQSGKKYYEEFQPYYEELIKDGITYYRQLNPLKVKEMTKQVWHLERKSITNRASLEWHLSGDSMSETRGYVAYQFQQRFIAYLNDLIGGGNQIASGKMYQEQKFAPKYTGYKDAGRSETGLPIKILGTIYVFDNRLRTNDSSDVPINTVPLQDYVDLLNATFHKELLVEFMPISRKDLVVKGFDGPVLILQDVVKELFGRIESNDDSTNADATNSTVIEPQFNPLAEIGFEDPKTELYELLRHVPKQTLNVNPNKVFDSKKKFIYQDNYRAYFNYDLLAVDKTFKHKLHVSLNELYLKFFMIRQLPVLDSNTKHYFPCFAEMSHLKRFAFLHRNYFLYVDDQKRVQIVDVRYPVGRKMMTDLLQSMAIEFHAISTRFNEKYYLKEEGTEKEQSKWTSKWKNARFIFSPGVCAEIEEPDERVLFPYQKSAKGLLRVGQKGTVQTDRGIVGIHYVPNEKRYIVGYAQGPKFSKMERATKVRRFDVYQGADIFDANTVLETMSVKFVRNEQYTVYPFFFDLINLHCENMGVD